MEHHRIKKLISTNEELQQAVVVMVEGNPGALSVITQLLGKPKKKMNNKEADEFMQGMLDIHRLDDQECYGSNIWLLYKDVCGQDINKTRKAIRDYKVQELLKDVKNT